MNQNNILLGEEFKPLDKGTSPILYMSKINTLFSCPMRYWWIHHAHFIPKSKNQNMLWGSDFHEKAAVAAVHGWGVAQAEILTENWEEGKKEEMSLMLGMLQDKMEEEGLDRFIDVEQTALIPISTSPFFKDWTTKSDHIGIYKGSVWNGELKTTSGYGAATASYYHNSMQTLHYFHYVKSVHPEVRGTKLFVVVRAKKEPRVAVEDIILTKDQMTQAELFRNHALAFADRVESEGFFPRFMTKCHTVKEGECAFKPICFVKNEEYRDRWIPELYDVRSPDEHLGLGTDLT